jgi:tetratricopeptide (TPR) repeat protein
MENSDMTMTEDQVRDQMSRASDAYSSGDYTRAADLFGELFVEPYAMQALNEVHWNFAMCQAHLGNMPNALEHVRAGGYDEAQFREACRQSNIRDAHGDFEAAVARYSAQRWSEAADAFTELLLHPGIPNEQSNTIRWNLAMCLAQLGQWEAAIGHIRTAGYDERQFREACRQSNLRDAQHDFAEACATFTNGDYSTAADAFVELMIHPGMPASSMPELHWNLALCLAHLDQWESAFGHVRSGHHDIDEFRRTATQRGLTPPDGH